MDPLSQQQQPLFVWCPERDQTWVLRRLVSEDASTGEVVVALDGSGEHTQRFRREDVHPFDESHSFDLDDVAKVNNLHEAPLLDMLSRRYDMDKIYTYAANVLISINPYKHIPFLYDIGDAPVEIDPENPVPHVYTVSEKAFQALKSVVAAGSKQLDHPRDQSVIVSGESGAGKTEASKYVMQYLLAASRWQAESLGEAKQDDELGNYIQDVLLQSNTVLEAFGNAKTLRNDNSSRFGKYTMLLYNKQCTIVGGATDHFLLEKSRLVSVNSGERNYHIFYQMTRGLDADVKASLHIGEPEQFRILSGGNCTTISDEDDEELEFQRTSSALTAMGTSQEEQLEIWRILAFLMHLGNVTFANPDKGDKVNVTSPSIPFEELAAFLHLDATGFRTALTVRLVQTARETFSKSLNAEESLNNAQALIKWIYGALFSWIVRRVNQAHSSRADRSDIDSLVGILDIFGFEIMRHNSFEQLCINYANEMLQQQFNEHIFVLEQEEYRKEGINCSVISFRDNQHVIDLISKKPSGLLIILEEHGFLNRKPDNKALLSSFNNTHFNKHEAYAKTRFGTDEFIVRHFAGDVAYDVANFIEKNNDSLQDDLMQFVLSSGSPFLQNVINQRPVPGLGFIPEDKQLGKVLSASSANSGPTEAAAVASTTRPARDKGGPMQFASAVTVSMQFRAQLAELVVKLRATSPHYIKCIKPNNVKASGAFSPHQVMQQLRYSGVLEVVRIRREAFPTREDFRVFYNMFKILAWGKGWPEPDQATDAQAREFAETLAKEWLPEDAFQMGHNKIFLRHYGLESMRQAVKTFYDRRAAKIQALVRTWLTRQWYDDMIVTIVKMQSVFRMARCRRQYARSRAAVFLLQAFMDSCYQRKQLTKAKQAVIILQKYARKVQAIDRTRKLLAIKRAKELRERTRASIQLQRTARGFVARCKARRLRSARLVQSVIRMYLARCKFHREHRARQIQARFRGWSARKKYAVFRSERIAAITKIQSVVRRGLARKRFKKIVHHLVVLQSWCRALAARRVCMTLQTQQRLKRERERRKAIIIQSYARMWPHRRAFLRAKAAATKIAALARRALARARYTEAQAAILKIQAHARGLVYKNRYTKEYRRVVMVQNMIRKWREMTRFRKFRRAVIALEAVQRMHMARKSYHEARRRIILVQSLQRMRLARSAYRDALFKATKIQARIRGFLCRCRYRRAYRAVKRVQQAGRRFVRNNRFRKRILELHHNAKLANLRAVQQGLTEDPLLWIIRNKWDDYKTLLHSAVASGNVPFVRSLRPSAADLFKPDIKGNMALHHAAAVANVDMMKLFADLAHPSEFKLRPAEAQLPPLRSPSTSNRKFEDEEEDDDVLTTRGRMGMSTILGPFAKAQTALDADSDDDEEDAPEQDYKQAEANEKIKMGYLRKKHEETSWQKRWIVLTQSELMYFKKPKSKRPKRIIPLSGAMVKKSATVEATFELYHPSLLGKNNRHGMTYFRAESEAELQSWMTPLRAITGVGTAYQAQTKHLDLYFRKEWVRMTNKFGQTALHSLASFRTMPVTGKTLPTARVVQAATWLIEMGCDVNVQDVEGNTALHFAEMVETNELIPCLIQKGADAGLRNSSTHTPLDSATPEVIHKISVGNMHVASRTPLLAPPTKLAGYTYLSLYLEKILFTSGEQLESPFLSLSIYNNRQKLVESVQEVSRPILSRSNYLWWAVTWHMQTPLENLDPGCILVLEFKDRRTVRGGILRGTQQQDIELAWTTLPMDIKKIESRSFALEMQLPPFDHATIEERRPADCMIDGDMLLTRKLFEVDVPTLIRSLEDRDDVVTALNKVRVVENPEARDVVGELKPSSPMKRHLSRANSPKRSPPA